MPTAPELPGVRDASLHRLRGGRKAPALSRRWPAGAFLFLAAFVLLVSLAGAAGAPDPTTGSSPTASRDLWRMVLSEQQAIMDRDPEQPDSLFWAGVATANLGQIEESRRAFERLDRTDPWRTSALVIAEECQAALAKDPNDLRALNGLAFLAYAQERYAEAAASLQEVVRLDPGNPWPRSYLGFSLGKAGRLDEAVKVLEEAVRLFPKNEVLHFLLGLAYYHKGSFLKAVVEMAKAPRAARYFR